ncbi:MAG: anhydro-N-acetylmuramic acid kinase [Rhodospirillales bacterium]|nr:anhydro-N-acetylmuramic acid kinase [Rhodospirillales bacterium]MCB9973152.1 anhydro-N-acetylmuramic acid kinase [Rhodospirillales bacterium]MCB9980144.1 anhydro-N-acetylmuramic acid kinase [Rhodospirillales bacterium]
MTNRIYTAIGLMSGTSLDGVDAALIETDGHDYARPLAFYYQPYEEVDRAQIRRCYGRRDRTAADVLVAEELSTRLHIEVVRALLRQEKLTPEKVDVIGLHGQTIFHAPAEKLTIQLGDGALMARETGIDTVYDFRSNDVLHGGEGAPLAPLYHRVLGSCAHIEPPFAFLNIGGVSNVTWVGAGGDDILAFDLGPGNALMDDWAQRHTGARYDEDGKLAAAGTPVRSLLDRWHQHPYFDRLPPKSLDRDEWDIADLGAAVEQMGGVSIEDGMATLLQFTAECIIKAEKFMPVPPQVWYVGGGGRHNKTLMSLLKKELNIHPVDDLGWNGDATEGEMFAYFAVRSLLGLPISFPGTTGVPHPLGGGVLARTPPARDNLPE